MTNGTGSASCEFKEMPRTLHVPGQTLLLGLPLSASISGSINHKGMEAAEEAPSTSCRESRAWSSSEPGAAVG